MSVAGESERIAGNKSRVYRGVYYERKVRDADEMMLHT